MVSPTSWTSTTHSLQRSSVFAMVFFPGFSWWALQINKEIVKMQRVTAPAGEVQLKRLIQAHVVRFSLVENQAKKNDVFFVVFSGQDWKCNGD